MREWEKNILKVTPYTPGEQPKGDVIKLNTNENPYPPSPAVKQALSGIKEDSLRKYPDPEAHALREAISGMENRNLNGTYLSPEMIFTGVGSDDVLSMIFLTFFNSEKPVFFPDVTYSFYEIWAELYGTPCKKIPLNEKLEIVPSDYAKENGGVLFPNPNAPTGILLSVNQVEEIVEKNQDSVVVVDEAYIDFGGESCIPLLKKYDNLIVVKTFSKSRSMAGMRIGYAAANEPLIRALTEVRYSLNSYPMNAAAIRAGTAAASDQAYFESTREKILKTRSEAEKRLSELGFSYTDSAANFLFVTHPDVPAKTLFEDLKKDRIYVRYFDAPRTENYLRITVGTDEEMECLYKSLLGILADKRG